MTLLAVFGGIVLTWVALYAIYALALLGLLGFDEASPWYIKVSSLVIIIGIGALWWFLVGSHVSISFS